MRGVDEVIFQTLVMSPNMRSSAWLASRLTSANGTLSSDHARAPPLPAAVDCRGIGRDDRRTAAEQAATLKRLAKAAYELDAFKPNLTRAEADLRIAVLTAKLKLLDGPPHTL
jgi:hypothetical protein